MTLEDYAAPSCQFRDCDADPEKMQEHPRHGEVQVCSTCAALWGRQQRMTAPPDETDSDFL